MQLALPTLEPVDPPAAPALVKHVELTMLPGRGRWAVLLIRDDDEHDLVLDRFRRWHEARARGFAVADFLRVPFLDYGGNPVDRPQGTP